MIIINLLLREISNGVVFGGFIDGIFEYDFSNLRSFKGMFC